MLRQLSSTAAALLGRSEVVFNCEMTAIGAPACLQTCRGAKSLQIVLLEDYPNLGKKGETVSVRPGYMRNFLYPKRVAVYATPKNLEKYQETHEEDESAKPTTEAEIDTVLRLLTSRTLVAKRRVSWRSGEQQGMVGQVTAADVAELCRRQLSVDLDPKMVMMDGPLSGFGDFKIPLNLVNRQGQQLELGLQILKTVSIH